MLVASAAVSFSVASPSISAPSVAISSDSTSSATDSAVVSPDSGTVTSLLISISPSIKDSKPGNNLFKSAI